MSEQQSTLGEPMYVESLMTKEEWNVRLREYPSSNRRWDDVNQNKTNAFKWRLGMGDRLSAEEIRTINKRLDAVLQKAGLL